MKSFNILVPCAIGVEKYLANELKKLNLELDHKEPGRIRFTAGLKDVYTVLRSSRLAERVLLEFARFKAMTFDQFYQGVRDARWQDLLGADASIHLEKVRLRDCKLNSVSSLQAQAQKAISDTLMRAHRVPELSGKAPRTMIRIYGEDDYFRIALDLSGEALHKRGWRKASGAAPLKETIAASMLVANVWRRKTPLHDPFCGSGTICLEALSFAANLPPNLYRTMAIEHLGIHQPSLDKQVQEELRAMASFNNLVRIKGTDLDAKMVGIANENLERFCETYRLKDAERAWVKESISFIQGRMEDQDSWAAEGLLIMNPPYGERLLDPEQAKTIHSSLTGLRERYPDWALSVITTEKQLGELLGVKTEIARPLHNGASEVVLYRFGPLKPPAA